MEVFRWGRDYVPVDQGQGRALLYSERVDFWVGRTRIDG